MKHAGNIILSLLLGLSFLVSSCGRHGIKDKDFRERVTQDFAVKMDIMGKKFFDLDSLGKVTQPEKEALEFLYAYMPMADVTDYGTAYYLSNVRISFSALADFPWGKDISEPLFYHYVMPIRVSNENLDTSRAYLNKELFSLANGKKIKDVILAVNHWCHEKAACEPTGTRTESPMTCILNAAGNQEEISILLVSSLRSIGIPSRMTFRKVSKDSTRYRVEAWAEGTWYALDACRPEPALQPIGSDGLAWETRVFGYYGPHAAPEEKVIVQDIYYAIVQSDIRNNPQGKKPISQIVTEQMRSKNDSLNAKEERKRKEYESTFMTLRESSNYSDFIGVPYLQASPILMESKGNVHAIKQFLHDHPDNRALEILEDLTLEDLRDVTMDVLLDSYDAELSARKPKVENEYLTPYKKYFLKNIPEDLKAKFSDHPKDDLSKGIREIIKWTKANIRTVTDSTAWYLPMSPVGVWKSRITDPHSRDIFFVALVRTFGNEARIDPETGNVQYNEFSESGITVPGYTGPVPMTVFKMKQTDFPWIDVTF